MCVSVSKEREKEGQNEGLAISRGLICCGPWQKVGSSSRPFSDSKHGSLDIIVAFLPPAKVCHALQPRRELRDIPIEMHDTFYSRHLVH